MHKFVMGSREFERRKLLEASQGGHGVILRRQFSTTTRMVSDGSVRGFDFTISTAAVDRYGDTVAVNGWKLANFRKNPVVLWSHDNQLLPIGKGTDVRIEDNALKARVEFTPPGLVRFNDIVFDMIKNGFLSATSVGFAPIKYAFVDKPDRQFGIDFLEQELLEFSVVTVPANAEALVEGRNAEPTNVSSEYMSVAAAKARLEQLKQRYGR